MKRAEILVIRVDFSHNDVNVLTVGRENAKKEIEVMDSFLGDDAKALYLLLTTGKLADQLKGNT